MNLYNESNNLRILFVIALMTFLSVESVEMRVFVFKL